MNPDIQAQTDAIVKAVQSLETTMHQDALFVAGGLGALLVILIIVILFRR